MIDEQRTYEKYKYYSTDLSPRSCKKIVAVCDKCGKIRETTKHGYRSLCVRCSILGRVSTKKGSTSFSILTRKFFKDIYGKFTVKQLSKMAGCNVTTIYYRLKQLEIPVKKVKYTYKRKFNKLDTILTYEFLFENYIVKELSSTDIGKLVKLHPQTIILYLKKRKIKVRNPQEICLTKNYRANSSGENSVHWKGGTSPLCKSIRDLFESKNWVISCFSRDDYTCRKCGKRGCKLEVNHIKPFAVLFYKFLHTFSKFSPIKNKEELLNLAKTWKPFWDIDNGETLCKDCHKKMFKRTFRLIKLARNKFKEQK